MLPISSRSCSLVASTHRMRDFHFPPKISNPYFRDSEFPVLVCVYIFPTPPCFLLLFCLLMTGYYLLLCLF